MVIGFLLGVIGRRRYELRMIGRAPSIFSAAALAAAMVSGAGRAEPASSGAATSAKAAPRACPALQFSNCHYVTKPNGADFAGAYPMDAAERRISGYGVIRCSVAPDGWFRDCTLVAEGPPGEKFGRAALQLSRHFRMKMDDGSPIPAGTTTIDIPIRFNTG
jgi:protein TonB